MASSRKLNLTFQFQPSKRNITTHLLLRLRQQKVEEVQIIVARLIDATERLLNNRACAAKTDDRSNDTHLVLRSARVLCRVQSDHR